MVGHGLRVETVCGVRVCVYVLVVVTVGPCSS